jgi:hypothetical protein
VALQTGALRGQQIVANMTDGALQLGRQMYTVRERLRRLSGRHAGDHSKQE